MSQDNERRARELVAHHGPLHEAPLAQALDEAEARGAGVAYERCADSLNHAIFVLRAGLTLEDASKALSVSRSAIYEARERKPQWVPVSEKPADGAEVFGEYRGRVFRFRRRDAKETSWGWPPYKEAWDRWINNNWYGSGPPERWQPMGEWMPLPEPPTPTTEKR